MNTLNKQQIVLYIQVPSRYIFILKIMFIRIRAGLEEFDSLSSWTIIQRNNVLLFGVKKNDYGKQYLSYIFYLIST